MKGSNEFNNQTMQSEEYIICINDEIKVNQVREESEISNLQIEISSVKKIR
jgi:hypothetical protein